MNNVINNIRTICAEKGVTQEFLSEKMGYTQGGFNMILRGKRKLSADQLYQIANILEIEVIDLITYPLKYVKSTNVSENNIVSEDINIYKRKNVEYTDLKEANKKILELESRLEEKDMFINLLLKQKS